MRIFAVALAGGIAVGWLRGGRLRRLAELRLRLPGMVALALALQAGASLTAKSLRFPLIALSYCVVGAWLLANLRGRSPALRAAIGLLAVGWMLNTAVILPNGGMPVSEVALQRAGFPAGTRVDVGHLSKHVAARARSAGAWLGDVVPVRPLAAVLSVGDVLLFLGVAVCISGAMTGPHGTRPRPEPGPGLLTAETSR